MRELLFELLLRLPKLILATVVALLAWWITTSFAGATPSPELWLLCFIGGGTFVLLVQEGPI